MAAGLVLAGGLGRRFGGDKLLALVDGEASVARVVAALRAAGLSPIYLSAPPGLLPRCRLHAAVSGADGCIADPPLPCGGPGAAVYTASLLARVHGTAVAVPGDAAWLHPGAVARLLSLAPRSAATAVLHGGGYLEPILVLPRDGAPEPGDLEALCRLRGELRPTDALRAAPWMLLLGSGLLCCSASCFSHLNTREALRTRELRNPLSRDVVLLPGMLRGAATATRPWLCGRLREEHRLYTANGVAQLARQAARDMELLGCQAPGTGL